MDCSLPGPSVRGIFQAIVLEWIAISFSRGYSQPRERTWVSRIVDRRVTVWARRRCKLLPFHLPSRKSFCSFFLPVSKVQWETRVHWTESVTYSAFLPVSVRHGHRGQRREYSASLCWRCSRSRKRWNPGPLGPALCLQKFSWKFKSCANVTSSMKCSLIFLCHISFSLCLCLSQP